MAQSDRPVSGGSALMTTFSLVEQPGQLGGVDEGGDLGLELRDLHRLGVAGRVVARLLLQLALDRVLLRGDLLDVAGLDLLDEERLVGHPLAVRRAAGDEREHEVDREQPDAGSR